MQQPHNEQDQAANESWLKTYYFIRAAVAAVWVFMAFRAIHSENL